MWSASSESLIAIEDAGSFEYGEMILPCRYFSRAKINLGKLALTEAVYPVGTEPARSIAAIIVQRVDGIARFSEVYGFSVSRIQPSMRILPIGRTNGLIFCWEYIGGILTPYDAETQMIEVGRNVGVGDRIVPEDVMDIERERP